MAGDGLRIGFVSSWNAGTGMASVHYPDRMGEVTGELPVFAPCGMMQVLRKGDAVLVLHLSNGREAGIVLGSYSVRGDVPGAGITVDGGQMTLKDSTGSIPLSKIIAKCR